MGWEIDGGLIIRLLKLHLIAKIALFGIFAVKFFDHVLTHALKIFHQIYTKMANFTNQSKFRKKSILSSNPLPLIPRGFEDEIPLMLSARFFQNKAKSLTKWPYLSYNGRIILEAAVQGDKVMQSFKSKSFVMVGDHSQMVKAPTITSDYGLKDCVNLSPSTAVSRII